MTGHRGPLEKFMTFSKQISSALMVLAAGSSIGLTAALAQPPAAPAAATPGSSALPTPKTGRENLARLQKVISVDMKEWKLEEVIKHLTTETEAYFEPVWKSGSEEGLDPEMLITFSAKGLDGVTVLEKVLEKASGEAIVSDEKATWQITSYGAIQIGPRKILNKSKRTEVYDVSDLLFEVPVYDDVPVIDLAQVLQNSGGGQGGGGGQSGNIFGQGGQNGAGNQQRQEERRRRRQELVDELKRLLTSLAEKDQWEDNGGSGGTMTIYQGNIIVDAPDYMHRAVAGYAWWPSAKSSAAKGRRYVSLSGNVEAAKVIGLTPFQENGNAGGNPR
ncbi:MAG: hypothetical protein QM783_14565 [Phycisphaerales bacterium]